MSKPIRVRALMLALSSAFPSLAAHAATDDLTVVVTATRFPELVSGISSNLSVITRDDIERSPARNIPDLLKTVAGLDVRPLYGSMGIDATVDSRGTGEAAGSNTLILVDGQRLNPVNMGGPKWETIPLSSIKQIEIVRGSGSVLYGDRAAAGVINIITDKSDKFRASAKLERGSFGFSSIDASLAGGRDGWYGNLFAHDAVTDGYRRNSDAQQTSAGGRAARRFDDGEAFVDFSAYREQYGLPGSLSRAQYDNDPRQTPTPKYRLDRDGYRLRPGGTFKLGKDVSAEIDGSYSDDLMNSVNPDWFYRSQSRVKASSFSPRLKWTHGLDGARSSQTIAGIDVYDGKAIGDSLDFATAGRQNRQTGQQRSQGIYAQNHALWNSGFDTTLGLRRQHFEQNVNDEGANLRGQSSDDLTAWELGAGYRLAETWRIYIKAARNFRLPNTDELFAYDPVTYKVLFNGALKPQTGELIEAGFSWRSERLMQQFSLFQQDNSNEIGYIAANGRNANLDPTRRRGAEWEARWQISQAWMLRASLSALQATFSEGIYSGKNIPLVPRHKETLGIHWNGGDSPRLGMHSLTLVSVGSRNFGGDFSNIRNKLDGYATLDYQMQWNIKPYSVLLRAANLTDRRYSAAGYSSAYNPGTYYPADPRSFSLSLKAEF